MQTLAVGLEACGEPVGEMAGLHFPYVLRLVFALKERCIINLKDKDK